ncbi:hypothetical protein HDU98_012322 [Podochytrium sp. JEL0797]|nr:hypothetical protein HDU98_012316 [Podochytrium sp. JEL0797]KAJ3074035.1 hypothetical protein HDU98_012322 [Podochytrium sp. JEL0797]
MAATIQINATIGSKPAARRRVPSDPFEENIHNMVLRPSVHGGIEDRPAPLYKSKFAHHVRTEHLKSRCVVSNPVGSVPDIARSAVYFPARGGGSVRNAPVAVKISGGGKVEVGKALTSSTPKQIKLKTGRVSSKTSGIKGKKDVSKIPAPKSVSKPISKPTSGRIAMAAERRSNASTPVVADPNSWDNLAADAAERSQRATSPLKQEVNYEEVPEELIEQWDPFSQDIDAYGGAGVMRKSSPPPTEMETGIVRKHGGNKEVKPAKSFVSQNSGSSIGGGSRRRMLPEAERFAVLAGLKSNYQSLLGIYNRLPVATDTVSKINRKTSIEKQLNLLEEDIKKFSSPNIIVDEGI